MKKITLLAVVVFSVLLIVGASSYLKESQRKLAEYQCKINFLSLIDNWDTFVEIPKTRQTLDQQLKEAAQSVPCDTLNTSVKVVEEDRSITVVINGSVAYRVTTKNPIPSYSKQVQKK